VGTYRIQQTHAQGCACFFVHHVFQNGTQHVATHNHDVLVAAFPGNQDVVMLIDNAGFKHRPLSPSATFTPLQATEMEEAIGRDRKKLL